ncbi:ADP-heptose:LPS heptosyltransferase [Parafrankia irregularis]|uniref:ADP-heptose:LPS heptosyltransferase n=1 Tax=Parafrankia irregularis TaxID=795642 RepID=A0A0S4QMB2_9ACTN|nr:MULTISPECIES: glycosyltransferase family 9 protein [Parafrankia]MBE3201325.1 glycosyl transferase family 9 [Parafrankia sp. CH37]CUU56222.1 ADP-heptose:LPS heptosyltransferase [Parafrankia irregularis]
MTERPVHGPRPALPAPGTARDILVIELLGGFGDLLLALPALEALIAAHPHARMRVVTFLPGADLLAADERLDRVVAVTDHSGGSVRATVRAEITRRCPDLAVTTTRHSGIPRLLSDLGVAAVDDLWRGPPPDEPVDARFVRLLAADGVIDTASAELARARSGRLRLAATERLRGRASLAGALAGLGTLRGTDPRHLGASGWSGGLSKEGRPTGGHPPVILIPEAGMSIKQWPADRWRQLASRLLAAGWPVARLPSPEPPSAEPTVPRGKPRAEPWPPVAVLPASGLREAAGMFAALGERGGLVVGGDTGPCRLAAVMGVRTVALYGPTLATRYGLHRGWTVDLQGLPGCSVRRPTAITTQECWWSGCCPLDVSEPACLADITVQQVMDSVRHLCRSR